MRPDAKNTAPGDWKRAGQAEICSASRCPPEAYAFRGTFVESSPKIVSGLYGGRRLPVRCWRSAETTTRVRSCKRDGGHYYRSLLSTNQRQLYRAPFMPTLTPFHHAFPVRDIAAARHFYGQVLGLPEGRSDTTWTDYDLFGHQIVAHENPDMPLPAEQNHLNPVDGQDVPVPHFGVVLQMDDWQTLADRLTGQGIDFVIDPTSALPAKWVNRRQCSSSILPVTLWNSKDSRTWSSCSRNSVRNC